MFDHSPTSYWQETISPIPLSTDIPQRADIVIIGGGILGTAICYWLARAGVSVVLLERTKLAHGATGRNGGYVSIGPAGSYTQAIARLGHETVQSVLEVTLQNQALLRQVLAEEKIACSYHEPGSVHVALSEEEWRSLAQETIALQADGIRIEMLDRDQVQELVKTPLSSDVIGGRFLSNDGVIHPAQFVQELAQACQRYGAKICNAEVTQIISHNDKVQVYTTGSHLYAGTVMVATNAWIGELLPAFTSLMMPVRGQMLSYAPTAVVFPVGMSASLTQTGEYWQQRSDGIIVLGGGRAAAPGYDEGIRTSTPTDEVQRALEQVLPRLFPSLQELRIKHRWAGLMAFTPDYLPIADQVPDNPNVWVVGGCCGHGMPFAMRLSQLLTKATVCNEAPEELKPFRLDRATLKWATHKK